MMEELCAKKYPNLTFVQAIEKLKKDGWITVMNRQSSNNKKYLCCEILID
jgi:hypothetical protein